MKAKIALMLAGLSMALLTSNARIITKPVVSYSMTNMLRIDSMELIDTATIIHFSAHHRPGWWVTLTEGSYLQADGKKYAITDTCGMSVGRPIILSDAGEHSFSVTFQPLPVDTRMCDFIENSASSSAFNLIGIDLTGKLDPYKTPDIPQEYFENNNDTTHVLDVEIRKLSVPVQVEMLNWNPGLMKVIWLELKGHKSYRIELDENGKGTKNLEMVFPERVHVSSSPNVYFGSFVTAPGDTVRLYLDAMAGGDLQRGDYNPPRRLWASGKYKLLNDYLYNDNVFEDLYIRYFTPNYADYRRTGKDYVASMCQAFKEAMKEADSLDMPLWKKKLLDSRLQLVLLLDVKNYKEMMAIEYENSHLGSQLPYDSIATTLDGDDFAVVGETVNPDNELFLLLDGWDRELYDGTYPGTPLYDNLSAYSAALKWALQGELDTDNLKRLTYPALLNDCVDLRDKIYEQLQVIIPPKFKELPDVSPDRIVESLVEKHPGKVVVFCIWSPDNYVPYMIGNYSKKDVVIIYLTDTTSPLSDIYDIANCLHGDRYLLNEEQSLAAWRKYGVDITPYYIIADRDGELFFGPGLRNRHWMNSLIEERIEKKQTK